MMTSLLMSSFIVASIVLLLIYFYCYARPLAALLSGEEIPKESVEKALRRFPLYYSFLFLFYILVAPTITILSLEMTPAYMA